MANPICGRMLNKSTKRNEDDENGIQDPNQKEEHYKLSVKLDGTGVPIFDAQKIE